MYEFTKTYKIHIKPEKCDPIWHTDISPSHTKWFNQAKVSQLINSRSCSLPKLIKSTKIALYPPLKEDKSIFSFPKCSVGSGSVLLLLILLW